MRTDAIEVLWLNPRGRRPARRRRPHVPPLGARRASRTAGRRPVPAFADRPQDQPKCRAQCARLLDTEQFRLALFKANRANEAWGGVKWRSGGYSKAIATNGPKQAHIFGHRNKTKRGNGSFHWTNMTRVQTGDVVFSGYEQKLVAVSVASGIAYESDPPDERDVPKWPSRGWRIDVLFSELKTALYYRDFVPLIASLLPKHHSPFSKTQKSNLGYLF